MQKVFIVVENMEYEGDTVLRVFAKYDDAINYIKEMEKDDGNHYFTYDIREREVY
jgi:hypothetical protein